MTVDLPCSHCGREPSHPQIRYRFIYAAYHRIDRALLPGQRAYVAALCLDCYEADRAAGSGRARQRFLGRARRWSEQPANRGQAARLVEHPGGITGTEWESDSCFLDGVAVAYGSLAASAKGDQG